MAHHVKVLDVLPWRRLSGARSDARIGPGTLRLYARTLNRFCVWLVASALVVRTAEDVDFLAVEYGELDLCSLGEFSYLLSALRFFYPQLAGPRSFPVSQAYKLGWTASRPVQHTVPMTRVFAIGLAARLFAKDFRMAIGLLVQFSAFLRSAELLRLRAGDVVLPEWVLADRPQCVLVLGDRARGTKVRRQQTAEIKESYVIAALRYLVSITESTTLLFPFSYQQFNAALIQTAADAGIGHLGFTAHSARAGAATQAKMDGRPFEDIREDGRWASAQSLRIYLDRAMAISHGTTSAGAPFLGIARAPWRLGGGFYFRTRPLPARSA